MQERGIFITWSFWKDKKTTLSEKALLLEIQNLSELKKGCIANNEHFAELMGVKKEAISRLISSLEKKGYINSKIQKGSRNFSRTITINKMLLVGKQNVISPLTNCLESKENKTKNKTYIDFKAKFPFINESSFDKLIQHLEKKFSPLTGTRITNNIKKLKDNPSLFTGAVNQMVELDYSGLFVPSSKKNNIPSVSYPKIDLSQYE